MSQVLGKAEDLADSVVIYGEAEPEALTKKLAKAACRLGLCPSVKRQVYKS